MSTNDEPPTVPARYSSLTVLALSLLLAACATSGAPAPEQPDTSAAGSATEVTAATAAEPAAATEAPAAADVSSSAAEPEAASSPVAAYLEDPAAITAGRRMFRAVCTGYCHSTTPGVTKDGPESLRLRLGPRRHGRRPLPRDHPGRARHGDASLRGEDPRGHDLAGDRLRALQQPGLRLIPSPLIHRRKHFPQKRTGLVLDKGYQLGSV